MKQIIALASFLMIALVNTGCIDKRHFLKGEGDVISDERSLSSVREIDADGSMDVSIYHAETGGNRVIVTGYRNLVTAFETKFRDGKLTLKFKDKYWNVKNNNIHVTVFVSKLNRVDLDGSGNVTVRDDLNVEELEINVNGSGAVALDEGEYERLKLHVNGSGEIKTEDATAETVYAEVSGSGYIGTYVSRKLWARVSGSGTINYWGRPPITDTKVSGSGKINKK